jgi:hypothetical protein
MMRQPLSKQASGTRSQVRGVPPYAFALPWSFALAEQRQPSLAKGSVEQCLREPKGPCGAAANPPHMMLRGTAFLFVNQAPAVQRQTLLARSLAEQCRQEPRDPCSAAVPEPREGFSGAVSVKEPNIKTGFRNQIPGKTLPHTMRTARDEGRRKHVCLDVFPVPFWRHSVTHPPIRTTST